MDEETTRALSNIAETHNKPSKKYAACLYKTIIGNQSIGIKVVRRFETYEAAEKYAGRCRSYKGYNVQAYWEA